MGAYAGPDISEQGLVLALDAGNTKSYPGSGTSWSDLSGQGNNGTLVNGVGYNGGNGGSLVFDGVNDRIEIPYTPNLAFTDVIMSCESWVYVDSLSSAFAIINKRGNNVTQNNNRPYVFEVISNGRVRWILDDSTTVCDTATGLIQTGQWYHLAATHDGTNAKIYINGVENVSVSSGTSSLNDSGDVPVRIGWRYQNSTINHGNGKISISKLYNRALTAAEVSQNFNALRGRFGI